VVEAQYDGGRLMTDNPTPQDAGPQSPPVDPRVYFAAERTLLAWVRTGLAMMSFGFVVARFGLFLREMAMVKATSIHPHSGFSLWVGTTLVIFGVLVNVAAGIQHWFTIRRLEQARPLRVSPWSLSMAVALLLALFGLLMAIYLIVGLDRPT
jgi:putative membrane protein